MKGSRVNLMLRQLLRWWGCGAHIATAKRKLHPILFSGRRYEVTVTLHSEKGNKNNKKINGQLIRKRSFWEKRKACYVRLCYPLYIPFVWWCDWLAVLLVQILVGPAGQIPKDCSLLLSGPYSSVLNQMHPNLSLNYAHWSHLPQLHKKKHIIRYIQLL